MTQTGQRAPAMAREILNYFIRNPHAADNLEGIASWRLLEEAIHRRVEDTRRALDWLVAEGYLREIASGGMPPIYSLNREQRTDAEWTAAADATPSTGWPLDREDRR